MNLAEIQRELGIVRLGEGSAVAKVLPAMRELADVKNLAVYSCSESLAGWRCTRWDETGDLSNVGPRFLSLIESSEGRALFYDLVSPEPKTRNRVMEATAWIDRRKAGVWESSQMCHEVFEPIGLARAKHVRALLCEGNELLGWFGSIHVEPQTRRQRQVLAAMIPAMRQRLAIERRLGVGVDTSLGAILDRLGTPALVIGKRGQIRGANGAARTLLDTRRADVRAALIDEPSPLAFEVTEIGEGDDGERLAILRPSDDTRIADALEVAARRWSLTPRQRTVLEGIVRGDANPTIALRMRVGLRAVELHVTALLTYADVESRTALVAAVLMG